MPLLTDVPALTVLCLSFVQHVYTSYTTYTHHTQPTHIINNLHIHHLHTSYTTYTLYTAYTHHTQPTHIINMCTHHTQPTHIVFRLALDCKQDRLDLSLEQKANLVQLMQTFRQQCQRLQAKQQQLHQALAEVSTNLQIPSPPASLASPS